MADTEKDVHPTETGTVPVKKGKKQALARHCKKFWWLHLIIFIIIVVLVVVLVIFVGVPKIAQSKINDAKLEIQGVHVIETESKEYLMQINSTITTDGSVHADVDGFTGDMYLEDIDSHKPFASIDFPETNANKHQTVNVSQHVKITDMDAFTTFNIWFQNNKTLDVTIKGKTKLKPSGLAKKYSVDFKKTITQNGLNVFKGTKVTDGHISLKNDKQGNNFKGTAEIPNASDFTLDIGNATFINYVDDEELGKLYIDNLFLVPGTNKVDIRASMDQISILKLVQSDKYCKTGVVPFKLLGESVVNHGQNISYFAAALASVNQTVEIDIGSIIEKDLGTKINCKGGDDDDN